MMATESWVRLIDALRDGGVRRSRNWAVAGMVAVLHLPHGAVVVARDADDDTLMIEAWGTDGEVLDRLVVLAADESSGGPARAALAALVREIWHPAELRLSA
jgi:hypothetical protein